MKWNKQIMIIALVMLVGINCQAQEDPTGITRIPSD